MLFTVVRHTRLYLSCQFGAVARRSCARRGVAALEFALVAPVFLFFLFSIMGVGLDGFYQMSLDDAVRDGARQIQIDAPAAASANSFVAAVCQQFGRLAVNCTMNLTYSVQASTQAAGFASITPARLSAGGQLDNNFFATGQSYGASMNLLVQVAYRLPFTLPYVGMMMTATGTDSVLATVTVRAEPFN